MKTQFVSEFRKVFPTEKEFPAIASGLTAVGEHASVQWVVRLSEGDLNPLLDCRLVVKSGLRCEVTRVGYVPNLLPVRRGKDDYILSDEPGLYPDVLEPFDRDCFILHSLVNNAFHVTFFGDRAGEDSIRLSLFQGETRLAYGEFPVVVKDCGIRKTADCRYTDWIHFDGIAREHGVKLFDESFYRVFDDYLRKAVTSGVNMLMIPAWTPSLDTYVGGDRTTAQLISVERVGDRYEFGFEALDRFLNFAAERGIEYYEFPPLVSQWTGEFAVKIAIREGDEIRDEFGWQTKSDDSAYVAFLGQLLPALDRFLHRTGRAERTYFHLSDELESNSESAARLRALMKQSLRDVRFFDTVFRAGEDRDGFEGVLPLNRADEALAEGHAAPAVYYCWEQYDGFVSNRFLNMPLARTALIGAQMYGAGATLLLHWGFNFYNSCLSRFPIDPFFDTCAGGMFQGGDAFLVYPDRARGGAMRSLRFEAMYHAFLAYRMLSALAEKEGKKAAHAFLREEGIVGYGTYPKEEGWYEAFERKLLARL